MQKFCHSVNLASAVCLGLLVYAASANAQTPAIVCNNAQLTALSTTTYAVAVRLGFATPGDSDPVTFTWNPSTSSLCTIPGGDGGSQIPSAGGGCWTAHFAAAGADVRAWGSVTTITNVNNALAWAANNSAKVIFPAGTSLLRATATVTVPAGNSVAIEGMGADVTVLRFPPGVSGININVNYAPGSTSTFHVRNMTLAAGGLPVDRADGLHLVQTGRNPNPANTAQSDVIGVTFRGADGYRLTDGWSNDIYVRTVSNINFINDDFVGPSCGSRSRGGTPDSNCSAGSGLSLNGGSATNEAGVIYNVSQSSFEGFNYAIYYGQNTQGLTVTGGTNLDASQYGIYVPAGLGALTPIQLTFANSQCGDVYYCVYDGSGVFAELIGNNLIGSYPVDGSAGHGVQAVCNDCNIMGNLLAGYHTPSQNYGTGIDLLAGPNAYGGVISGNTFESLGTGINFGVGAAGVQTFGNQYYANTANWLPASGTNNNIVTGGGLMQGPAPVLGAWTAVTEAAGNGGTPARVRLTVTSTAQFVSGELVNVAGVGGIDGAKASVITPITVINGTQMDLNYVAFSGKYTGGGVVSGLAP